MPVGDTVGDDQVPEVAQVALMPGKQGAQSILADYGFGPTEDELLLLLIALSLRPLADIASEHLSSLVFSKVSIDLLAFPGSLTTIEPQTPGYGPGIFQQWFPLRHFRGQAPNAPVPTFEYDDPLDVIRGKDSETLVTQIPEIITKRHI